MTKRILFIEPCGTVRELPKPPSLKELQRLLGGTIEHVNVLDRIEKGRFIYTSMFINETGLIDGLPPNHKATEAYQRNIRAQYPNSKNPFKQSQDAWQKEMKSKGFTIIDARPEEAKTDEYVNGPWIAGPVVLFEGWTREETDDAICSAGE